MSTANAIALSSQIIVMRQMDVIANNLANASTTAFKGEHPLFTEYLAQAAGADSSSYVQDAGTARDLSQGPITKTSNPLDLALEGDGYFAVSTPAGVRYTRDGKLQLNAQGQITTAQGYALLDPNNNPIFVPSDAGNISVAQDGTISTSEGVDGRLQVSTFANPRALAPAANGLYVTTQQAQPATSATVAQGYLEQANIQPIVEITHLMAAEHSVVFDKDYTNSEATRISNAIDRLGKTV